jgi:hypothetical protein
MSSRGVVGRNIVVGCVALLLTACNAAHKSNPTTFPANSFCSNAQWVADHGPDTGSPNPNFDTLFDDIIGRNSPDPDTIAIQPDVGALKQVLHNPSFRHGPSSPDNQASWDRFREFVKKKCTDVDLGATFLKPPS